MKYTKKAALRIAAMLVAVGLVLCLGALAAVDFDLSRLNATLQIAVGSGDPVAIGIFFGS